MPHPTRPLVVAVLLDGAGAHPAAWRLPDSRAEELFTPGYWLDLARAVDGAAPELLLLPDAFSAADHGAGEVRGRVEALALAARLALETHHVGLVPTLTTTHTEPFHVAKAVQSLDHTSHGRAGWEVVVSPDADDAALVGRRSPGTPAQLWAEAGEALEVAVRLWDSWEDDAEIRDAATGRFLDRDKLHYAEFTGEFFSVKGTSITPRSPQGHAVVVVRAADEPSLALAAARADVVRIAAPDAEAAGARREQVRAAARAAGRDPDELTVLLDVEVLTAPGVEEAQALLGTLDGWAPRTAASLAHTGTPDALVERLTALRGVVDGVTLVPLALPRGLADLTGHVLPALRAAGTVAPAPDAPTTLRERLHLARPANRHTRQEVSS